MSEEIHKGWYSRKGLPHFDGQEITQFITFRLADSIPQSLVNEMKEDLKTFKGNIDREKEERMQALLDKGMGSCILGEPRCAELMQKSIQFLDPKRYELRAWVVMPNHINMLVKFGEGQSLSSALHSLKSYTGHELKKVHPELDSIWQIESFDRYIRNEEHYGRTLSYIHENPVTAGLCSRPEQFRWSSAFVG